MKKVQAKRRSRQSQKGKLLLAVMTFCNLLLTLLLAVFRRQEVIHAVRGEEEQIQVLLTTQKDTKKGKTTCFLQ